MVQITRLSNNIPVLYEYVEGLRSTALGIYVKMGSAYETRENNGISHVIEHMLFKGTQKHSSRELADIMSDLGNDINAYTSKEATAYYGRVLNEDFDRAAQVLGELITEPTFDEKELAKEKHVIIDEIDLYEDSAEDMCHELLQKRVWKNSPYGYIISGTKKNVKSFTSQQLVDIWKQNYCSSNLIISVAGGVSSEDMTASLEQYFGGISDGEHNIDYIPEYSRCFFTKYKDTEQVHMNIAMNNVSAADDERYPVSVINASLGGNLNARLFQKVREELGLTYNIYSYSSLLNGAGLLHIYASMNPSQTIKVFKAVKEVLADLQTNGMKTEEIETIKKQIRTELILSGESASARMTANVKSYMALGRIEELDETIDRIMRVTPEEVDDCIHRYFNMSQCSMSLIGDISHINEDKLKKMWK